MDSDDWDRFRSEVVGERRPRSDSTRLPFSYFLRHMVPTGLTEQAANFITNLVQSEKSYQDFQTAVASYVRSQTDEMEALLS